WVTFEPTSSQVAPGGSDLGTNTTGKDETVQGNGTQPGTDNDDAVLAFVCRAYQLDGIQVVGPLLR
ncbi:MAG: hypothetical protein QF473_39040, partial [Planctomycetota bacterium]|nr:hypothetical protein [Planctomycetota bacterium]